MAVMALIGSLVVIGKGLGEFAESILPFEQMNVPRIKQNITQLSSISGEITELMNMSGGRGIIAQAFSEHPLTELANALGHFDGDKGSKQRPTKVSDKEFQDNWEKIFGKKEPKVKSRKVTPKHGQSQVHKDKSKYS